MKVLQLIAYSCPTPVGSGASGDRLLAEVCVEKGAVVVRSREDDVRAEIELYISQTLERDPYSFAVVEPSFDKQSVSHAMVPQQVNDARFLEAFATLAGPGATGKQFGGCWWYGRLVDRAVTEAATCRSDP
jgi:hypothetical protein